MAQVRRPHAGFPAHRFLTGALVAAVLGCAGCQSGTRDVLRSTGVPDVAASPPVTPASSVDSAPAAPSDAAVPAVSAAPAEAVHGPNASNAAVDPASATKTVAVPDAASGAVAVPEAVLPAVDPALGIEGRVVYGVRRTARSAAVIDVCRCYQQIPAYQRIRREELPRTRADYHFLMTQATSQFEDAVEAVALRADVELVIVPDKNVVVPDGTRDLTDEVVAWLRGAH